MAKKKKTQLKPVARGFATTSVPKKVEPVEEVEQAADPEANDVELQAEVVSSEGQEVPKPADDDEFDFEKAEEQSLQNLIDQYQEKTEREILRTVKAIEVDRRFSATLPRLSLDPSYVEKILELVLETRSEEDTTALEGPEEKAVAKLAITYGVLRRLGYSESRVEECLRSIHGINLDEAYEWLYLHCSEEELHPERGPYEVETKTPKTPQTPRATAAPRTPTMPKTPRTPQTPTAQSLLSPPSSSQIQILRRPTPLSSQSPSPPSPAGNNTPMRLDANAPAFIPSSKLSLSSPLPTAVDDDESAIKSRILASFGQINNGDASSGRASPDSDDPLGEYVRLKLQIDDLTTHRRHNTEPTSHTFLRELQMRLTEVQKHYFFDRADAEQQYRSARQKADDDHLQARLRGEIDTTAELVPAISQAKKRPPNIQPPPVESASGSPDSSGSESEGGMFTLLEGMPSTDIANGVTIAVRDMGNPKQWSGRTPKVLLAETVTKVDRYAAITYRCISGSSRAKRAAVSVRGDGGKSGTWPMEDIACHDMDQAEQYIATVALHALTFPSSEGFALGGTSAAGGGQTFFRLLPAVFRDLWDELEVKRKAEHDTINRGVWAKLRSIVEAKMEGEQEVMDKAAKQTLQMKDTNVLPSFGHGIDLSSEQIMAGFAARQSSYEYQAMLAQRNQLPIAQYRQEIVSTLDTSQILVLSGETGCGKSTQLPAFILEDQLSQGKQCKIFCTEPRRISAISLAQRVSAELGDPPGSAGTSGSIVGYSVRLESNISRNTRLAFVTNGIALRMLEGGSGNGGQGTAFDEITHIIIDEVHERTIESDFLLIVLKSLLVQRPDLRIILMSATVDAEKIANFFGGCPTLHVPGRTFPVDVRYLEDAVEFTGWSIAENSQYARRLHDKFYRNKNRSEWAEATPDDEEENTEQQDVKLEKRYSAKTAATINLFDERQIPYDLIVRLLERICFEDPAYITYSSAILVFMPGLGEIRRLNDMLSEHPSFGDSLNFRLLPLHSTVSSENQSAVFDIPPRGMRKIVIATNIAETGITIPDITCVIDTGKHREMRFDEKRQLSRLVETFVAKSNAAQRRGRSGRVQDGLCFHLFTKIRHDTMMADHPQPEMTRLSLSDLALRIKIMKIQIGSSIEDVLTRALDPPLPLNIQRAVSALVEVRALTPTEEITPMGRLLSKLPTDVHLGKFLLIATVFRCLDPALTIAATLNAKSPFVAPIGKEDAADAAKLTFRVENSDFLTIHNAFSSWRRACANGNRVQKFCRDSFLSHQNLQQIEELRQQFMGYLIDASFIQVDKAFTKELSRARYSRGRVRLLTVPDHLNSNANNAFLFNAALAAGLYPKILSIDPANGQMRTISNNQLAAFHPSSINFGRKPADMGVHHLSFFTLMQSKRLWVWETGPVDDIALVLLCGECDFKLISDSAMVDRKVKFRVLAKTNVALKHLRTQLASVLAIQFRGKPLTESQMLWKNLGEKVLGKIRIRDPDDVDGMPGGIVVVNHQ